MVAPAGKDLDVVAGDGEAIHEVDPNQPARPMEVVFDEDGNHWLCDKGVDPNGDLAAQGCWQCGDFPFTRQD